MSIVPEAALNQHIAILGKTGSGKSYAAKGIVEGLLHRKRQVCVIDPTGAWWGLRLNSNGNARGFDVVLLGGQHADIPLPERSGSAVARLVTQQHANVVIDTSGMTVGEYTRWFIDFAGTLFTTVSSPLHLVIDEAHHFMPQGKSPDIDAGRMLHAGNRLMSGGRSKGIKGMLITQRPAKLHKDSLSCADTLIAMRVIAPQDRAAIKDWIDGAGDSTQGKQVLDSLAQLKRGEGWVWYPEGTHLEKVTFPKIATYDSSATPTGTAAGPKVSEIKLDEVKFALAEAVKEAEANDPKLLRKQIADLEKQLAAAKVVKPEPAKVERVEVPVLTDNDRLAVKQLIEVMRDKADQLSNALLWGKKLASAGQDVATRVLTTPRSVAPPPKTSQPARPAASGDLNLGKAERQILQAMYWLNGEQVTPAKVAFYSDYSAGSGGFNNSLGKLRSAGLLAGWSITAEGIQTAEKMGVEPKPTGSELREWLRVKLGKAENAILDALILESPRKLFSDQIAALSGYSAGSGGFNNALGKLRSIEAAVGYERDGGTKAADVFFE